MSSPKRSAPVVRIALAAVVVIVLAVLLGIRIAARAEGTQSRFTDEPVGLARMGVPLKAVVPEPAPLPAGGLPVPCWTCEGRNEWPVRFRTDLDLLAPLGDGTENAALWFKEFTRWDGPRFDEADEAKQRSFQNKASGGSGVLPADDPLLLEAEPWCDQATMKFYPEFLKPEGYQTQVPNLLFMLTLVRSWVARGDAAEDAGEALDDYRRVVRLGRLLRQEDATIISDLVGLACIRLGADGIYRRAIDEGDTELALVASIVLGEIAPQQLMTSVVVTETDLKGHLARTFFGGVRLEAPDGKVDALLRRAAAAPDRRFRLEALVTLSFIHHMGTSEQRAKTAELFEEMAASPDESISTTARWALETEPNPEQIGWFED